MSQEILNDLDKLDIKSFSREELENLLIEQNKLYKLEQSLHKKSIDNLKAKKSELDSYRFRNEELEIENKALKEENEKLEKELIKMIEENEKLEKELIKMIEENELFKIEVENLSKLESNFKSLLDEKTQLEEHLKRALLELDAQPNDNKELQEKIRQLEEEKEVVMQEMINARLECEDLRKSLNNSVSKILEEEAAVKVLKVMLQELKNKLRVEEETKNTEISSN